MTLLAGDKFGLSHYSTRRSSIAIEANDYNLEGLCGESQETRVDSHCLGELSWGILQIYNDFQCILFKIDIGFSKS